METDTWQNTFYTNG